MPDLFEPEIYTVSELTSEIKIALEENFSQVSVIGEVSNFKAHVSGHWYFNLKDSDAVINCTMWKGLNNYVLFTPQDGMKIIVNGRITVYPPRGNYQLDVRSMKAAGVGELQAAFDMLKKKLAAEGLFDEAYKKQIPLFPQKIGVVTASDGAAFKDIISVANRRFPLVEIILVPAKVQGSGSAQSIVNAIRLLNEREDIDVIIIARGGGSIEDLWAFNEEIVARAVFNSRIPVISGVGHEIDFTIADFVADLRAPTPSVAMELATPDINEFFAFINEFSYTSYENILNLLQNSHDRIVQLLNSYAFRLPLDKTRQYAQLTDNLYYKITQSVNSKLSYANNRLSLLVGEIESYDIQKILKRGFVLVRQDNRYITRKKSFDPGQRAILKFFDGDITLGN
ncbi:MAG: exodeoxyribonuclease VII large subunit [Ignavibacteriaceae bacterium]